MNEHKKLQMIEESGSKYFPLIWRMGKEPGQPYGTSLAADALTEGLQVNKLSQLTLEKAHKDVNPAYIAPNMLRGMLKTNAGAKTWAPTDFNVSHLKAIETGGWDIGDVQMDRLHESIDDKFFIRFFEMLTSRDIPANITAFQIQQMISEKAILMGALVGAFEQEYLKQAIDLQFAHEEKAGRLPEPPDVLFDGQETEAKLDISYEGPLAKMQTTLLESKPIIDGLGLLQAIGDLWPNSLIKVNEMKLIEDAGISVGMDQGLFKDDREVETIMAQVNADEARAEQIAESEAASKSVKNLSSPVDESSVLAQAAG